MYPQSSPTVAAAADGAFVVAWASYGQDGSATGVFGQRYDTAGQSVGTEFQVNSYTMDNQVFPAVAAAPDGAFVVAWSSDGQDGSGFDVFGQRFGETLTPPCTGDCSGTDVVTVDELITLVNIALGNAPASACPRGVPNGADVTVALIVQAVSNALTDCGGT